jgi:tartrate dehydratase alpha subunit/fumarate hydratase class I-like protein
MILDEIKKKLRKERGEIKANRPNKMIKVQLNFWTDNIASVKEKVVPKVCWDGGFIHILQNEGHGIKRLEPIPFNGLSDLERKIEEGLKKSGVKMLKGNKGLYYP